MANHRKKKPFITMSCLGKNGFFGNQLFQYAFLKLYAMRHDMDIQTPPWIGQQLFGLEDPPIREQLPIMHNSRVNPTDIFEQPRAAFKNVDFDGYFHYFTTKHYLPQQKDFRSLFRPTAEIKATMKKGRDRLRSKGKTVVAIHLRRGDFVKYVQYEWCFIAPSSWYKEWLTSIWSELDQPVLYIASDELESVLDDFREFNPVTAKDLYDDFQIPNHQSVPKPNINGVLQKVDFYPDFYILTQCDILGISNSTFSFSASMLNKRAASFYRPHYATQRMMPYDPWDSYPLQLKE